MQHYVKLDGSQVDLDLQKAQYLIKRESNQLHIQMFAGSTNEIIMFWSCHTNTDSMEFATKEEPDQNARQRIKSWSCKNS